MAKPAKPRLTPKRLTSKQQVEIESDPEAKELKAFYVKRSKEILKDLSKEYQNEFEGKSYETVNDYLVDFSSFVLTHVAGLHARMEMHRKMDEMSETKILEKMKRNARDGKFATH